MAERMSYTPAQIIKSDRGTLLEGRPADITIIDPADEYVIDSSMFASMGKNTPFNGKTYKIEVDCANCANKMEEAAKKTAGAKDAVVNFMTLKMNVEFEDGADVKAVMQDVLKNCKKVEDDCEIYI